jgi:predicted Zn-dependent peptidase
VTVQIHTLANGFRIVTENMPGLASAALGVWVGAGSRNERIEENGIAHFLEHMAFKGTERRTSLQIAEEIEDVGGFLNAYTSRETTAYYARVLAEDAPLALDIIADILTNPTFADEEIAVERGVILQEIGQTLDTPDDVIFDWLQEAAFPDQPMGRSILGPAERVRDFGRSHLADFVKHHYSPDRMILSAAGAVDHDQLVRLAEDLFGHLTPRPRPMADPALYAGGERLEIKELEQAHLALAFEGPGYRSDELYAGEIFATTLGGGMSSRLFQEAREKRGLCYTIGAHASAYAETGVYTLYAGTGGEQALALAELMIDEIRRAADDLSDREVARARAQLKAGLLMGLESPSNRAERMARSLAIWGRTFTLEETVAKIEAVDAPRARAAATAIAETAKPTLALYGPVETAPSADALAQRLAA